MCCRKGFSLDG
ncbi:hypothetical protein F383_35199 [Gossypium arboreum]|uniref:Uncharacterized protein n=1 Tax=Gossypium arboreum TaxID=29729 RepID=A0A0B0MH62_GOSAR|nr:hypothetical protein F383_37734 [Gossypium arboreum]KHG00130.1 hypothetical protein F383_38844 [Gossypium arboreum]KHG15003.1 hypothetical protein F383_18315 [Gossypium arboreum]KHG17527.1 hypothetical protein F383_07879 [Gossypium arboreum]KHG28264.1 hypothetical protein F383_09904 [Gossypium arboreum]